MTLCKLIDRTEYLLFALVLLPTFLVIAAAVVSLTDVARAMESALWQSVAPSIDEDDSVSPIRPAVLARSGYGLLEWPALLRSLDRVDPSYRD